MEPGLLPFSVGQFAPPRHLFTPAEGRKVKKEVIIPVTLEFFLNVTLQVPSRLPPFIGGRTVIWGWY